MAAVIDHRSSRTARWLADRRWRAALSVAVIEGIIVAIEEDVSRWTVIALAIIALAFYVFVARELSSPTIREIAWIAAASQLLTVLVVVVAFVVGLLALVLVAVLAALAILFLLADRG